LPSKPIVKPLAFNTGSGQPSGRNGMTAQNRGLTGEQISALEMLAGQIAEAKARREAGEALTDIGRSYNVSHSTISRLTD
jgi:hypothetical protein